MEHKHITFYNNSQRNAILGVEGLIEDDSIRYQGAAAGTLGTSSSSSGMYNRTRTAVDKHIEIVEYLKQLPSVSRATYVDIKKVLDIDLEVDEYVFDMMKSNPKLDFEISNDGICSFQYRDKYRINNIWELKQTIDRVKTGVMMKDIITNYPTIEHDCNTLIIGGDIIACKNKVLKSLVLFPREQPFYTQLSGTITAVPGSNLVKTSVDLTSEIRRGDAIRIPYAGSQDAVGSNAARYSTSSTYGSWYRVATAEKDADRQVQSLSVTTEETSTLRGSGGVAATGTKKPKVYHDQYTSESLPLDGDFDGEEISVGKALRHGCTNDVRACWHETAIEFRKVACDEKSLETELKRLSLITKSGTTLVRTRPTKQNKKKDRKKRVTKTAFNAANSHLSGTELGRFIESLNES